ncbi:MAG: hypothetical protein H0U70_07445 [Tatlockia sp.]|nr:hypothetical protein [Tatlockia sp.]
MKFLLSILLLSITSAIFAENDKLPSSCKAVEMNEAAFILSTEKPTLVMISNLSKVDLWLTHPSSDSGASAGWSSRLEAGNWSALALEEKSFEINCIESKPGHEQQIPCAKAISACKWPMVKSDKEKGSFWAGENMNLPALISHLEGRGFKLPAS